MVYGPSTHTVQEVLTAVQRQFGDEAGVQINQDDIIRWINDAQDEINTRNRIMKAVSHSSSVAAQQDYTFPAIGIVQVESIHFKGSQIRNMPFAEAEKYIFDNDPTRSQAGTPQFWYEWAGTFTFWPTPADVQTIDIYYTAKTPPVTTLADLLSIPDKYYQSVVRYVMSQAYELDEDWQAVQAKQQEFDGIVNDLGEEERTAQNMTYSTVNVVD